MKLSIFLLLSLFVQVAYSQTKYTDWEKAKAEATNKNKNILIVLTGSEWCAPCVKMKKNVFNNPNFINYVNQNLVLFEINLPKHLDFNIQVVKDYYLFKEKYQSNALPSLILVDNNGIEKCKITKGTSDIDKVMSMLQKNNTP